MGTNFCNDAVTKLRDRGYVLVRGEEDANKFAEYLLKEWKNKNDIPRIQRDAEWYCFFEYYKAGTALKRLAEVARYGR